MNRFIDMLRMQGGLLTKLPGAIVFIFAMVFMQATLATYASTSSAQLRIDSVRESLRLGNQYTIQGENEKAFRILNEAYELSKQLPDDKYRRDALNALATVYYNLGQYSLAEKYYKELLDIEELGGNDGDLAIALFNLAHAYASQQKYKDAEQLLERSRALDEKLGNVSGVAFSSKALGDNALAQNNTPLAKVYFTDSLAGFESVGNRLQIATMHIHLGDVARREKQYESAISHYKNAVPLLEYSRFTVILLRAYRGLAGAYSNTGNFESAYSIYNSYALLLQNYLEKQSSDDLERMRTRFETERLSDDNQRLELVNTQQQEKINADREIKMLQLAAIVLSVTVIALVLFFLHRGKRYANEMRGLATTDELTQLPNRRSIMSFARREWDSAQRSGRTFSCLMFDIDHFKLINDTYGHQIGDEVLVAVAKAVNSDRRKSDCVGRVGGEEFLLIASESSAETAAILADRVRRSVEELRFESAPDRVVTISIGVVEFQRQESLDELIQHADSALYEAKSNGRNQVVVCESESKLQADSVSDEVALVG